MSIDPPETFNTNINTSTVIASNKSIVIKTLVLTTVFFMLLSFSFLCGYKISTYIHDKKVEESVIVGGFIHNGKVYEVRERIVISNNNK